VPWHLTETGPPGTTAWPRSGYGLPRLLTPREWPLPGLLV